MQGRLYIVSAPSGAGKSSLIQALLSGSPCYEAQVSISHTTRRARPGEVEGEHYYFVSHEQFTSMVAAGAFLEYAQVFDHFYGTSRETITQALTAGVDVLLDIDWQGARQVRQKMPQACSVFILPPSKEALYRRLRGRGQDSETVMATRMARAAAEISHYTEYDYVIINEDFAVALDDLRAIIRAGRLQNDHQCQQNAVLISKLLAE